MANKNIEIPEFGNNENQLILVLGALMAQSGWNETAWNNFPTLKSYIDAFPTSDLQLVDGNLTVPTNYSPSLYCWCSQPREDEMIKDGNYWFCNIDTSSYSDYKYQIFRHTSSTLSYGYGIMRGYGVTDTEEKHSSDVTYQTVMKPVSTSTILQDGMSVLFKQYRDYMYSLDGQIIRWTGLEIAVPTLSDYDTMMDKFVQQEELEKPYQASSMFIGMNASINLEAGKCYKLHLKTYNNLAKTISSSSSASVNTGFVFVFEEVADPSIVPVYDNTYSVLNEIYYTLGGDKSDKPINKFEATEKILGIIDDIEVKEYTGKEPKICEMNLQTVGDIRQYIFSENIVPGDYIEGNIKINGVIPGGTFKGFVLQGSTNIEIAAILIGQTYSGQAVSLIKSGEKYINK